MANNIVADVSLNIRELMREKKIPSEAELGRILGVSKYVVSKWKTRNTYDIDKIVHSFPDVNRTWLTTGEGQMLKEPEQTPSPLPTSSEEEDESYLEEEIDPDNLPLWQDDFSDGIEKLKGRPYYDVDFFGGYGSPSWDHDKRYPEAIIEYDKFNYEGVTYVNLVGDSMAPMYRSGDIIAIKEIYDFRWLPTNRVYCFITSNEYRTVKILRRSTNPDTFYLEAINPEHDDQEIPREYVVRVFDVLGKLPKKRRTDY